MHAGSSSDKHVQDIRAKCWQSLKYEHCSIDISQNVTAANVLRKLCVYFLSVITFMSDVF